MECWWISVCWSFSDLLFLCHTTISMSLHYPHTYFFYFKNLSSIPNFNWPFLLEGITSVKSLEKKTHYTSKKKYWTYDLACGYYFYRLPNETFFSNKLASRVISKIILIVLLRISSKYIRYQPSFFLNFATYSQIYGLYIVQTVSYINQLESVSP